MIRALIRASITSTTAGPTFSLMEKRGVGTQFATVAAASSALQPERRAPDDDHEKRHPAGAGGRKSKTAGTISDVRLVVRKRAADELSAESAPRL